MPFMPTVGAIIERLFPEGTNFAEDGTENFPAWPPDAFAITSYLINKSGLYCDPRYISSTAPDFFFASNQRKIRIEEVGSKWGKFRSLPIRQLQRLWDDILDAHKCSLHLLPKRCKDACIELMMMADTACAGVGFASHGPATPIVSYLVEEHKRLATDKPSKVLRYAPYSLCRMVPFDELCVQPKTMTAQIGCTLRSYSHHLALLPSFTEVATAWMFGIEAAFHEEKAGRALNLLVIPFPFHVEGNCFVAADYCFPFAKKKDNGKELGRFFTIEQKWLEYSGRQVTAQSIAKFLLDLVTQAERDVAKVNGIILPELALDQRRASQVAEILAGEKTNLELFITGVSVQDGALSRNCAQTFLFKNKDGTIGRASKEILSDWSQSKHHRWKLDKNQIRRYHLGDQLEPNGCWWEMTDIDERGVIFYAFRDGMSLATLVCEDLARIDPVQSVIRSVGPNLVVALLMDGPQLERRWSGRYATVLADDPGSAVLTLTSLGLMKRSVMPGEQCPRQIALFKGADGVTHEMCLPCGHHALLLTLTHSGETNYTVDGRSDDGTTFQLSLSGAVPIKAAKLPKWVQME